MMYRVFFALSLLFPAFAARAFEHPGGAEKGIVPCVDACDFKDFIALLKNAIDFGIYVAPMIAAIIFAYGGFLYMTAGSNQGQTEKAKEVFRLTLIGLVFVFGAWLIVNTVLSTLTTSDFSILGG